MHKSSCTLIIQNTILTAVRICHLSIRKLYQCCEIFVQENCIYNIYLTIQIDIAIGWNGSVCSRCNRCSRYLSCGVLLGLVVVVTLVVVVLLDLVVVVALVVVVLLGFVVVVALLVVVVAFVVVVVVVVVCAFTTTVPVTV